MKSKKSNQYNRRQFLKAAGAAIVLPTILPGCAMGRSGRNSASNKITLGVIGWGMQGPNNTKAFMVEDDCRVVAACDLDKKNLQQAVNTINDHYKNNDCAAYHDYHDLLSRDD